MKPFLLRSKPQSRASLAKTAPPSCKVRPCQESPICRGPTAFESRSQRSNSKESTAKTKSHDRIQWSLQTKFANMTKNKATLRWICLLDPAATLFHIPCSTRLVPSLHLMFTNAWHVYCVPKSALAYERWKSRIARGLIRRLINLHRFIYSSHSDRFFAAWISNERCLHFSRKVKNEKFRHFCISISLEM